MTEIHWGGPAGPICNSEVRRKKQGEEKKQEGSALVGDNKCFITSITYYSYN